MKWIFFIPLILPFYSFAQKYDFNWPFGYGYPDFHLDSVWGISTIRFDSDDGNPYLTEDKHLKIALVSSNVSQSDKNGVPLFYFNGDYILGGGNTLMTNGDNMSDPPFFTTHQAAVSLPLPNDDHRHILLHKDITVFPSLQAVASFRLLYSIIEFPDQGGYGQMEKKRVQILADTMHPGHMTATRHANGRDWWLLSKKQFSDSFYVFLITPDAVTLSHIQQIGSYNHPAEDFGEAKFSMNGKFYCHTMASAVKDSTTFVHLFEFDRCNGLLSNETVFTLPESTLSSGAAFSPDSRFLYLSLKYRLYQVDLHSSKPDTVCIDWWDGTFYQNGTYFCRTYWGPLINGPDGKIYAANFSCSTQYLNVIEEPNQPGLLCRPRQKGLIMPSQHVASPHFPNYRLGPVDGSVCDSLGIDNIPWAWWRYDQDTAHYGTLYFKDLTAYEPAWWIWDFGDGQGSTEQHPTHAYAAPGTYEVCLIAGNNNGADTLCRTIELATVSANAPARPDVNIAVMPNPFKTDFTLQWSGSYLPARARLRLFDLAGRLVHMQQVYSGWNTIELPHLPLGCYFWEVDDAGVQLARGVTMKQ